MKLSKTILIALSVVGLLAACEGEQGPVGPAGPTGAAGPSVILGYATVAANGTVQHFGGAGTDSVTVSHTASSGVYDVTFHGSYPGVMANTDVTGMATIAGTAQYNVASQSNIFVTAETEITSRVWVWSTRTTPNPLEDRAIAVFVLR